MRSWPKAVCGGVGRGKSVLQTGTTRSRDVSARTGVTSDEAENAPRLRVANGEDSQESKPPVKRRARTHTASAQDSSPPVPWRWGSRTIGCAFLKKVFRAAARPSFARIATPPNCCHHIDMRVSRSGQRAETDKLEQVRRSGSPNLRFPTVSLGQDARSEKDRE
jgi:hypothetical protein